MNETEAKIRAMFQEAIDVTSEYEEQFGGAYPEGETTEIAMILVDLLNCRGRLIDFARRMDG